MLLRPMLLSTFAATARALNISFAITDMCEGGD